VLTYDVTNNRGLVRCSPVDQAMTAYWRCKVSARYRL